MSGDMTWDDYFVIVASVAAIAGLAALLWWVLKKTWRKL